MASVALLSNPRSTGNRSLLPRVRAFCAEHKDIFHYEVEDVSQIALAMRTIARVKPKAIVINGGDGTVQAVLTELHQGNHFLGDPPPVAVMPNGKTNLIAHDLGAGGDPIIALERVLDLVRGDMVPHIVSRELIALSGGRAGENERPVLGMFLGGAGLADTILYCRHKIYPLGLPNWMAHFLTFLHGHGLGGHRPQLAAAARQVEADQGDAVKKSGEMHGKFAFVMVTTLEKLLLNGNVRVEGQRAGAMQLLVIERNLLSIFGALFAALRGRLGLRRIRGVHLERGDEIRISGAASNVILDGEMFRGRGRAPDRPPPDRAGAVPEARGLSPAGREPQTAGRRRHDQDEQGIDREQQGAGQATAAFFPALRSAARALVCADRRRGGGEGEGDRMLRRMVRAVTPGGVRLAAARARRAWGDSGLSGARPRLARRADLSVANFPHAIVSIRQQIRGSAFREGKLANIRLGAARLDDVVVAPGETFSFWALVGRPSAAAGFRLGRSIRGGVTGGDIGGGLCQLSGIAYEAGLRAGLAVAERHPHSRDLYTEEERFTPLGLDATVVWPWKDLRLVNPHDVPVRFGFAVGEGELVASVSAPVALPPAAIEIERRDQAGCREVRVLRRAGDGAAEPISDDVYAALPDRTA